MMKHDAKVVVVTGAARGIGLAIARKFLEEGYQIAILDIDETTLSKTMKEVFDTKNVSESNVMFQNLSR